MPETQSTSLKAYLILKQSGKISDLQEKVYKTIFENPNRTDLELSYITKLPINVLTARRNELYNLGVIKNSGKKMNLTTSHMGLTWECGKQNQEKNEGLSHTKFMKLMSDINQLNEFQRNKLKKIIVG